MSQHRPETSSVTPPNITKQIQIPFLLPINTPMILNPQQRNLFAQRLALLIRRIRASTLIIQKQEVPDEY
jgi:hypothetical protein